jgi:hypothetical protein
VTNIDVIEQRMSEVRKGTSRSKNLVWPRDFESFKGGNFNTLSLVDCYVQICNGTAVEHGSLLNCSGVCDGINWNHKINTKFLLIVNILIIEIVSQTRCFVM